MRRRLLISTLAVAVTAVVLFGLPLAFVMSRLQITAAGLPAAQRRSTITHPESKLTRIVASRCARWLIMKGRAHRSLAGSR
jgi:hypothetical protein